MSAGHERGFGLVELMVAMALSLLLLAGTLAIVLASQRSYRENDRIARLQEVGRTAIELILRDVRSAGFRGCARDVPFTNTLNDTSDLYWNFEVPVQGFESVGTDSWSPPLDPKLAAAVPAPASSGSVPADIIAARTLRVGARTFRTAVAMPDASSDIAITKRAGDSLESRTPLLISDCAATAVFELSAFHDSGTTATLSRVTGPGSGIAPGNAVLDLGNPFAAGSLVAPVAAVVYYLAPSTTGSGPALWRIVGNGGTVADEPEELLEGVEALELLYGEDTNGDRYVDRYVAASGVTMWDRIVSINAAVLVRSAEPNAPMIDSKTYDLLGTLVGPFNDRYQRAVYATTATLRNGAE